jgi:hypothetical protein
MLELDVEGNRDPKIAMAHREHLFLIKSTTDGERLREHIREEREDAQRQVREIIAESQRLIEEANRTIAALARITAK